MPTTSKAITTPWTPYDEAIVALPMHLTPMQIDKLHVLMGSQTGYRLARAEAAPLVEAAKAVNERLLYTNFERILTGEQLHDLASWNAKLGSAVAQSEKGA